MTGLLVMLFFGSSCHYQWHRRTMDSAKLRQDKHTDHGLYLCLPDTGGVRLWSISNAEITADSITGAFHEVIGPKAAQLMEGRKNHDLRPNKRSVILHAKPGSGIRPAEGAAMGFPRSSIERVERIKGDTWGTIGLALLVYAPFALLGTIMENMML